MEFHEAAGIFPLDEEHIAELAEDIRENGQRVPIDILGGKVLDGRRRFLACRKLGVKPKVRDVSSTDPVGYVVSLNLHRRHLTTAQLAMCAARARDVYDRQAKGRQKEHGGTAPGRKKTQVENLPPVTDAGKARDQAGKAFGVSGASVDYATKVLKEGTPELVKAVDEGRMAVSTAAILASEPEGKQRAEAAAPKRRRTYKSLGKAPAEPDDEEEEAANGKPRGVGVFHANEAINCLIRIPKNDRLRRRGFQIVTDWIKAHR